jgi:cytochrome c-type biogenesis protein CcmH
MDTDERRFNREICRTSKTSRTRERFALLGLIICTSLLIVAPVIAQGQPPTADDVNRVASKLYCPICENEPLDVCQTAACVQWKAQISQYLAEGKNDEEIVQIFVDEFGLQVLGEPPAEGVTLILWIGPIMAVLIGGAVALWLIRNMARRSATANARAAPTASSDDPYIDQVERDLKQHF